MHMYASARPQIPCSPATASYSPALPSASSLTKYSGTYPPIPSAKGGFLVFVDRAKLTLDKRGQDLAPRLQERVADDNLQEALQAFATVLDDVVGEAVGEDLAGERGDGDTGRLAFEDVAEGLKVRIAPPHRGLLELEGRDVGLHADLIRRVHAPPGAVGLRVANLEVGASVGKCLGNGFAVGGYGECFRVWAKVLRGTARDFGGFWKSGGGGLVFSSGNAPRSRGSSPEGRRAPRRFGHESRGATALRWETCLRRW